MRSKRPPCSATAAGSEPVKCVKIPTRSRDRRDRTASSKAGASLVETPPRPMPQSTSTWTGRLLPSLTEPSRVACATELTTSSSRPEAISLAIRGSFGISSTGIRARILAPETRDSSSAACWRVKTARRRAPASTIAPATRSAPRPYASAFMTGQTRVPGARASPIARIFAEIAPRSIRMWLVCIMQSVAFPWFVSARMGEYHDRLDACGSYRQPSNSPPPGDPPDGQQGVERTGDQAGPRFHPRPTEPQEADPPHDRTK